MSAFAHSFELLKNQCIQIVNEMTNQNYGSASSTGSDASSTGSHDSYTEHDGITEYPDYHSHETYESDTEEQQSIDAMHRITDAMQALQWHEPDDDFANSALIIDLKKKLDSAWDFFHNSDQFLTNINAARAACAWLMCTLLQANFAHANATPHHAPVDSRPKRLRYMTFEAEFQSLQTAAAECVADMHILPESNKADTLNAITSLAWVAPDQNIANSTAVCRLRDIINSAWDETHYAVAHLVLIQRLNAALAWILADLMQENFPQSQQTLMDLNYVVEGIKDKLTEVEHNRLRNEKDIRVYFKNQRDTYQDLLNFKGNTEGQLKDMARAIVESKDSAYQQRQEMIAKIDRLDTLFSKLAATVTTVTTPKKGYLWAKMPPETHTLPGLLAQLERPDTP